MNNTEINDTNRLEQAKSDLISLKKEFDSINVSSIQTNVSYIWKGIRCNKILKKFEIINANIASIGGSLSSLISQIDFSGSTYNIVNQELNSRVEEGGN